MWRPLSGNPRHSRSSAHGATAAPARPFFPQDKTGHAPGHFPRTRSAAACPIRSIRRAAAKTWPEASGNILHGSSARTHQGSPPIPFWCNCLPCAAIGVRSSCRTSHRPSPTRRFFRRAASWLGHPFLRGVGEIVFAEPALCHEIVLQLNDRGREIRAHLFARGAPRF